MGGWIADGPDELRILGITKVLPAISVRLK